MYGFSMHTQKALKVAKIRYFCYYRQNLAKARSVAAMKEKDSRLQYVKA